MEGASRRTHTHIIWKTIHGISNRIPPTTLNNSITFNNKITTMAKHIANSDTQHTKQTPPMTEPLEIYKDITLHSPQLIMS